MTNSSRPPLRTARIAALWMIVPGVLLGVAFGALVYLTQGPFDDVDAAALTEYYLRWALFGLVLWVISGLGGLIGVALFGKPGAALSPRAAFAWGAGGIIVILGAFLMLVGGMSVSLAAPIGLLALVIAACGYALMRR